MPLVSTLDIVLYCTVIAGENIICVDTTGELFRFINHATLDHRLVAHDVAVKLLTHRLHGYLNDTSQRSKVARG